MKKPAQRLRVTSLADAMEQLKDTGRVLEAQKLRAAEVEGKLADAINRLSAANQAQWAAEKQCEEMRRKLDELKNRLHSAELSKSYYEGYLERVREADKSMSLPQPNFGGPV